MMSEVEQVTARLYAQPHAMEPTLSQAALRAGCYRETGRFEKKLLFTDIGAALWAILSNTDTDDAATIEPLSLGDEMINWDIRISTADLDIVLRCMRLERAFWRVPRDALLVIDLDGARHAITTNLTALCQRLGYAPWEFNNWPLFERTTGCGRYDAPDAWYDFVDEYAYRRPGTPSGTTASAQP